jgi:S-DNA-T family DNA segregation ATPase FtsK/SpoIIIE
VASKQDPQNVKDILDALAQRSKSFQGLWNRMRKYSWDIGGILLIAFAFMTLIGTLFPPLIKGSALLKWVNVIRLGLGWGSIFVVLSAVVLGIWMLKKQAGEPYSVIWVRIFALEGAVFSLIVLFTVIGGHSLERARAGLDGGLVGWGLVEAISSLIGLFLTGVLAFLGAVIGGIIGLGFSDRIRYQISLAQDLPFTDEPDLADFVADTAVLEDTRGEKKAPAKRKEKIPPEFRKQFKVESKEEKPLKVPPRDEDLPSLELLITGKTFKPNQRHINTSAGLIEKTLAEFGIPAQVVGFQVGPTVTQFAVKPGFHNGTDDDDEERKRVRVSRITSLKKDLALALSAKQLRIEAPVPGRSYIGIEVPNEKSSLVRLRSVIESDEFYKLDSPLAIALGSDVSGEPVVADLATMPHLLIAGTTGSGKSVCITSITTCLVMNNTPEQLRLVMIDPKMVELVRFNGLPHLFGKVETNLERILGVLQWVVAEMDRRYQVLDETRSRNIDTYNRKVSRRKDGEILPRIVVLIDELADLMMMAPAQTEFSLVRLAQMARATGIHLVVATQRPSTDVVTGLIKANFPARMSFAVASSVDSRVVLDMNGAESLLGNGDMLFLPPEANRPIRAQGCIVTPEEVDRVLNAWDELSDLEPEELIISPWEDILDEQAELSEYDDLIKDAFRIVRNSQRASTSLIQRKLRIGYPRAARLMDELSKLGYVGPSKGSGIEREVFIASDEEFGERFNLGDND